MAVCESWRHVEESRKGCHRGGVALLPNETSWPRTLGLSPPPFRGAVSSEGRTQGKISEWISPPSGKSILVDLLRRDEGWFHHYDAEIFTEISSSSTVGGLMVEQICEYHRRLGNEGLARMHKWQQESARPRSSRCCWFSPSEPSEWIKQEGSGEGLNSASGGQNTTSTPESRCKI